MWLCSEVQTSVAGAQILSIRNGFLAGGGGDAPNSPKMREIQQWNYKQGSFFFFFFFDCDWLIRIVVLSPWR